MYGMFNMEVTLKAKFREIVADYYSANYYSTLLIKNHLKTPIQIDEYLREATHFVGDFERPPSKEKFREIVVDY